MNQGSPRVPYTVDDGRVVEGIRDVVVKSESDKFAGSGIRTVNDHDPRILHYGARLRKLNPVFKLKASFSFIRFDF